MTEETTELEGVREMIKYWQTRREEAERVKEEAERMVTSLLQEEKVILQRRLTI